MNNEQGKAKGQRETLLIKLKLKQSIKLQIDPSYSNSKKLHGFDHSIHLSSTNLMKQTLKSETLTNHCYQKKQMSPGNNFNP
jgi:hypothetical protein